MSDEDILKAVANELKMYGDFDNIDYLIPKLGQAIENILAKYNRALSDLVKAEKEKNELKEENIKLKNHCKEKIKEKQELTSALLDSIPVSLIKDIIEENKSYLEYANTAYEYTQREVIEKNIKILQKLIGDD